MTEILFEVLSQEEAVLRVFAALGVSDPCTRIDEVAVLSALLRRAASLSCPCPPATLTRRVRMGLRGLVAEEEHVEDLIAGLVDALTGYGDLIEAPGRDDARLHLYLAPPSFVRTSKQRCLLLGIAPDGADHVPAGIAARISRQGHACILEERAGEDLPAMLRGLGLLEIKDDIWFKRPVGETAVQLIQRHDGKLSQGTVIGQVDDLEVIDPAKPVHFYRGRWVKPGRLSGKFVGRRPQAYGAPLWCYVQLSDGRPVHLLDLHTSEWRGCDQAWLLQMALDANAGHPQEFGAELADSGAVVLRFFGPVPSWWQRRWDVVATRVDAKACLFAYEMSYDQYEAELGRLASELWLFERT